MTNLVLTIVTLSYRSDDERFFHQKGQRVTIATHGFTIEYFSLGLLPSTPL